MSLISLHLYFVVFFYQLSSLSASDVTCVSFDQTSKTNVTGRGDSCCAIASWTGSNVYGVSYQPYDSETELCCISLKNTVYGQITYRYGSVGVGDACCDKQAYDKTNEICCESTLGMGNACCGSKAYDARKSACCRAVVMGYQTYTVADACCRGGTLGYNKSVDVCCNEWNIGNGNACCNTNGNDNEKEPWDEPYYTYQKCCKKGKLMNYACANEAIHLHATLAKTFILNIFYYYLNILFH